MIAVGIMTFNRNMPFDMVNQSPVLPCRWCIILQGGVIWAFTQHSLSNMTVTNATGNRVVHINITSWAGWVLDRDYIEITMSHTQGCDWSLKCGMKCVCDQCALIGYHYNLWEHSMWNSPVEEVESTRAWSSCHSYVQAWLSLVWIVICYECSSYS